LPFGVAPQDAELVALGIRENEPSCAIRLTPVVERHRPQREHPLDLFVARPVGRHQVEVHWFFTRLPSGTSMNKTFCPPDGSMIMHSS